MHDDLQSRDRTGRCAIVRRHPESLNCRKTATCPYPAKRASGWTSQLRFRLGPYVKGVLIPLAAKPVPTRQLTTNAELPMYGASPGESGWSGVFYTDSAKKCPPVQIPSRIRSIRRVRGLSEREAAAGAATKSGAHAGTPIAPIMASNWIWRAGLARALAPQPAAGRTQEEHFGSKAVGPSPTDAHP